MFRVRNRKSIILNAINDLAAQSAVAQLSPGSKARAIVESVGNVVGNVSRDISVGLVETLLPNAVGSTLDLIADMFGIERLPEIRPQISAGDQNLKYYVRTGTFGSINNGAAISVPAGTEIKTGGTRGAGQAILVQRETLTLPADENEVYFSADQIGAVTQRGISANALTRHNFTGYTDAAFQALLVTNDKGVGGRSRESDQNLRFRVNKALTASAESNMTAIRVAGLVVPGVSDIKIVPSKSGLGTYDVIVFGTSPIVADSVIQDVQRQLDRHQAVGSRGIAVAPRIIGISFQVTVEFEDTATASDKNSAKQAIIGRARRFILDHVAGQELVINDLTGEILVAHPAIKDIGDPNHPYDELLIWRRTATGDSRFSRNLRENFTIAEDEELMVEPFIVEPIKVLEA